MRSLKVPRKFRTETKGEEDILSWPTVDQSSWSTISRGHFPCLLARLICSSPQLFQRSSSGCRKRAELPHSGVMFPASLILIRIACLLCLWCYRPKKGHGAFARLQGYRIRTDTATYGAGMEAREVDIGPNDLALSCWGPCLFLSLDTMSWMRGSNGERGRGRVSGSRRGV